MTVEELIEELKKVDGSKIVYGENGFGYLDSLSEIEDDYDDNCIVLEFLGN